MAFQGITAVEGEVKQLVELPGSAIIGTRVKAPFAINPEVFVLPMDNVLPTKVRNFQVPNSSMFSFRHREQALSHLYHPTLLMTFKP